MQIGYEAAWRAGILLHANHKLKGFTLSEPDWFTI